jgi:hypothetical protein
VSSQLPWHFAKSERNFLAIVQLDHSADEKASSPAPKLRLQVGTFPFLQLPN